MLHAVTCRCLARGVRCAGADASYRAGKGAEDLEGVADGGRLRRSGDGSCALEWTVAPCHVDRAGMMPKRLIADFAARCFVPP